METTSPGWWRRHGWTVALLLTAFGFSFAIRTVWSFPVISQFGPLFTYAGGSDSYYHSRVTTYIILTNHNLVFDPMLRFPVGSINPREPLFDWMNAVLGIIFAPFFGGSAVVAGAWFLDLQAPLWAALGVFPVYLIGREVSSRRTGLIAALIFPFLSANIDSSTFGYANYLSFYTFVILVVVYSYIRTVKAVGNRRWIANYGDVRQYWPGLKGFLQTERTAVKWAVFTGVGLGALALSWQGYTYAVVVIGVGVLIAMLAERVRKVDSFGLYVATWIIGLVGFPMAAPYYLVQHAFKTFFDVPLLLFFGVLGILLPFLLMRDVPWVFSIPALVAFVGAAALFLRVIFPTYFTDIVTGQGYFVKNLIYSTVAEAQAPSIDALVVGYGIFTFFLAFVGLAIFAYLLVHHRFKRYHVVFLVFAGLSVYLPISASKFFLLGSPGFALLAAEALNRALNVGGYTELRRTVASLSDRGSQLAAFRRAFKARHVLVLALVAMIIVPNVWISVDAGIPGNTKNQFAEQIADSIPSWLKLNASAPASNYLGAAGSSLDTANQYDSAAYNWLATQDTNLPPSQRPAFVSWWDYGFQAIAQGDHPSVADNFQNGIDPAGQFLLSQNESLAIAILAVTLLQAEQKASGLQYLPPALNEELRADGLNVSQLHNLMVNESTDFNLVVDHPGKFLPVNPGTLTDDNAMYLAVSYFIADSLPLSGVARLYNDIQGYTGWSIRYAMTDSRLFPFSGTDTGIFYAPADLTGRVINAAGIPTTFFNVTALTTTGATYPIGQVPSGVAVAQYQINYSAPFFNSMIYRIYIGYNGTQVGQGGGIPGLEGAAASDPLEPGFMLQHFEIVYKTAYVCPGVKNAQNGSGCFVAQNEPAAKQIANQTKGTVNTAALAYFQGGETMLAYYAGQNLLGTLSLPTGAPVPGVRVTVFDGWGTPHMTTVTSTDGTFSIVLPPGNDTLNFSTGTFNPVDQSGSNVLRTVKIDVPASVGFNLNAPNLVERFDVAPSPVQGYIYWNVAGNSSYVPKQDPVVSGASVLLVGSAGVPQLATTTDSSGAFQLQTVPPGVYQYTVAYAGHLYNETNLTVGVNGTVNATAGLTPANITGIVSGPNGQPYGGATVAIYNSSGVITTTTTGGTGNFSLPPVAPGHYTLIASSANSTLRSIGAPIVVNTTGSSVTADLTLTQMAPVGVEVLDGGAPVSGVAVRFAPILSFSAGSGSALAAVHSSLSNGTVLTTGANGIAIAELPIGNYSVYALGYSHQVLSAAVGAVDASSNSLSATDILSLVPALPLTGSVTGGPASGSGTTVVVAYGGSGPGLLTSTDANGSFAFRLPAGTYSLLALEGTNASGSTYAALGSSRAASGSTTTLTLSPAVEARLSVGTKLASGKLFAAANATVTVSAGSTGPAISAATGSNGSVVLYLPTDLPLAASGYCVNGSAPGFVSASTCGVSPGALASEAVVQLALASVPVTLNVVGVPTGTPVTVTLTAESPTAINRTYSGGPEFSFALPPGTYGVGAEAMAGNGSTLVYLPSAALNTTVPFGASSTLLTLLLIPQLNSTGTLALPTGLNATNVTISLSSPTLNVTVNGTDYLAGFHVAPGVYTASVTGTKGTSTYANLTRVTATSSGTVSPKLVLTRSGVRLTGTLESVSATRINVTTSVTLAGSAGTAVTVPATDGTFSTVLPPGTTYTVYANATLLTPGENGSFYRNYSTVPSAQCTVGTAASTCAVTLRATTVPIQLHGSLLASGSPGPVPGTVRLLGPYPTTNLTVLTAANGTFSAAVQPGAYSVYASSSSGPPYAGYGRLLLLPRTNANVSIQLVQGWVDAITISPSGQPGAKLGAATVGVADTFGDRTTFQNVPLGSTFDMVLPPGSYTINASAPGTLNGVNGTAGASTTVTVRSGNLASNVGLTIAASPSVAALGVGATTATVAPGGTATFSFTVRDAGNVPVAVHPVGSPLLWKFNFTWTNSTLQPGGAAASGEVRITLPRNAPVNHPPIVIQFETANGTVLGSVEPPLTVEVTPYYGVAVGRSTAHAAEIGATQVEIPFYVHNTGNTVESVAISVVDGSRLTSLGWKYNELRNGTVVTSPVAGLSPGGNTTFLLNLTAAGTSFVIPASVTLEATVSGVSGTYSSSTTLPVPLGSIGLASPTANAFTVLGPGIGSPSSTLPEWAIVPIVFAPAIALVLTVTLYRWWRTRKWTRR